MILIVKVSKFVYVNNCKGSYGSKALKSLQVLSPLTFRSSRYISKLPNELLSLSVILKSNIISLSYIFFKWIIPVSFVNILIILFKLKGPSAPVKLLKR